MSLREFRDHIKVACEWCQNRDDVREFTIGIGDFNCGLRIRIAWSFDNMHSQAEFSPGDLQLMWNAGNAIVHRLDHMAWTAHHAAQSAAPAPQNAGYATEIWGCPETCGFESPDS